MKYSIRLLPAKLLFVLLLSFNSFSQEMKVKQDNLSSFQVRPVIVTEELEKTIPQAFASHPEYGKLPVDAPCTDCFELIHLRTDTTRTYWMNGTNGSRTAIQSSYGQFNFMKDGWMRSIDAGFRAPQNGVMVSDTRYAEAKIRLNDRYTTIHSAISGDLRFNDVKMKFVSTSGLVTDFGPADWSDFTAGDDGIHIKNAWPGVDMIISSRLHGLKTNYIIKEALNLGSGSLRFEDKFQSGAGIQFEFEDGSFGNSGIGNILINDDNGMGIAEISTAVGFDALHPENMVAFPYEISGNKLSVVVPTDWLNSPETTYPVTVDPSVTSTSSLAAASINGSMYNGSCNFTNSCDYTVNVATPVNSTITDLVYSFVYNAYSPCPLGYGGMRITTGACQAQSISLGTAYTCPNFLLPGTCTANISVYSQLVSCLPAPSCASVTFPVTLNFYRTCAVNNGCSNSCIGAGAPFSVTVTGTNLETLGNTVTGNGSQTVTPSTCTGTSTLNPLPANGVPAYTYLWSNGATTPTITIPSASGPIYTANVTDICGVTRVATFTIVCPLSVDYAYFKSERNGRDVVISWKTEFEKDNNHFRIERSQNSLHFSEIGKVISKGDGMNLYSFTDKNAPVGDLYYRVVAVDNDGAEIFSPVMSAQIAESEKFSINPNPSSGSFSISAKLPFKDVYNLVIYNDQGKTVFEKMTEFDKGLIQIPVSIDIESGAYTVLLFNDQYREKGRLIISK